MAIKMVKIRARITIGSIIVETPFILSFNVSLKRGQIGTFSASLKVHKDDASSDKLTGAVVGIEAGVDGRMDVIFRGISRHCDISPVWDDPSYVMLNLSGEDVLSILRQKKYTRRCRSATTAWCSIDGVVRKGLRSSKFKLRKGNVLDVMNSDILENSANTSTQTMPTSNNPVPRNNSGLSVATAATSVPPTNDGGE